ncbi:BTAD domain-containing putative transcriptional regulator [Micromonospora sp. NPDC005324]|uniref:AfsR/SARP family transcriptional regulator n=1 Tax=Micromonospora sp. NPDC005324 TaxID=3157033 RepID=UPI0033B9ABE7
MTIELNGEPLPVLGGKLRVLLASLLLRPNRHTSVAHLADRMWDGESPQMPRRVVQTNIVRLRQALLPHNLIKTVPAGYVLRVEPDQLDLLQFESLFHSASEANDLETEWSLLRDALGLWRGPVCEDVASESLRRVDAAPIAERRLAALDRRIEIDLMLGRDHQVVPELGHLTTAYPFRERFWVQLMAALYRSGRQAEALESYRIVYRLLADELGTDPGPELREMYQAILNGHHDHRLLKPVGQATIGVDGPADISSTGFDREHQASGSASVDRSRFPGGTLEPRELPPTISHFVGRHDEIARLDKILAVAAEAADSAPTIAIIDGPAGLGKTALAVRWCTMAAEAFPGGQLYVNLQGFGTLAPVGPLQALTMMLRSLGTPQAEIPHDVASCSNLFRSRTASRRVLVLLDNARSSEQTRALLPGAGCLAVITSRNQLRGLVASEAAERISVARLEMADSLRVLASLAGQARIDAEGTEGRRLSMLCDNSPLALRIIGERVARLPSVKLAQVVDELSSVQRPLDVFSTNDGEIGDMRSVLSWSYNALDPEAARVFRLVGMVYPGADLSLPAAAALCDLTVDDAQRHLDRLVANHLVEQHSFDRYRLHDLVRAYAVEQAGRHDSAADREDAALRLLTWFERSLHNADQIFAPNRFRAAPSQSASPLCPMRFDDHRAAFQWCETEYLTLTGLPAWAHRIGANELAGRVAYLLGSFLAYYKRWSDLIVCHTVAITAAQAIADRGLEGHLLNALGNCYAEMCDAPQARLTYDQAIATFGSCGDELGEAKVMGNLAMLANEEKDYDRAERLSSEALRLSTKTGYDRGRAASLDNMGEIHLMRGQTEEAVDCWRQALDINRRGGDAITQVTNLTNLGRAYEKLGEYDRSVEHHSDGLAIARELRSERGAATALLHLGATFRTMGRHADAAECCYEAFETLTRLGDPRAQQARERLRTYHHHFTCDETKTQGE